MRGTLTGSIHKATQAQIQSPLHGRNASIILVLLAFYQFFLTFLHQELIISIPETTVIPTIVKLDSTSVNFPSGDFSV